MNREKILEGAKEFFFEGMLARYFGHRDGKKITKIESSDGCNDIVFRDGDFKVVDRFYITPDSDFSAGTTTIFFENKPVWWMAYGGCYPAEAIAFLKMALKENYERGTFLGGRGPKLVEEENFVYRNEVRMSDFKIFNGRESIVDLEAEKELGFHEYFGMALI
ncbi:MAG: DUF5680 domain-containing protein [Candidatus Paceibacterota bacterium]